MRAFLAICASVLSIPAFAKDYGCNINVTPIGAVITTETAPDFIKEFRFSEGERKAVSFKSIEVQIEPKRTSGFRITAIDHAVGSEATRECESVADIFALPVGGVVCWSKEARASANPKLDESAPGALAVKGERNDALVHDGCHAL